MEQEVSIKILRPSQSFALSRHFFQNKFQRISACKEGNNNTTKKMGNTSSFENNLHKKLYPYYPHFPTSTISIGDVGVLDNKEGVLKVLNHVDLDDLIAPWQTFTEKPIAFKSSEDIKCEVLGKAEVEAMPNLPAANAVIRVTSDQDNSTILTATSSRQAEIPPAKFTEVIKRAETASFPWSDEYLIVTGVIEGEHVR